jgi:uncharacterized membrane protein YkvA (DUF1232 family)
MLDTLKERARQLKTYLHALSIAYRDPRTPLHAKVWTALVVGYAFSPVDLIPDFIPVLGYLDDLVLVPLGIWVALRLIPPPVMADAHAHAREAPPAPPVRWLGVVLIAALWLALAYGTIRLLR